MADIRGFGVEHHLLGLLEEHFTAYYVDGDGEEMGPVFEIDKFETAVDDIVAMLRNRGYLAKED